MRGASGPNAPLINGFYLLREGSYNSFPVYQKEDDPDKWLVVDKDECWAVKVARSKEANDGACKCYLVGKRRLLPTMGDMWKVHDGSKHVDQPEVVASAQVSPPSVIHYPHLEIVVL